MVLETSIKTKDAETVEVFWRLSAAGLLSRSTAARLGPDIRSSVPPIHQEESSLRVHSSVMSVKWVSQLHSTGRRQPAVFAESPAVCRTDPNIS